MAGQAGRRHRWRIGSLCRYKVGELLAAIAIDKCQPKESIYIFQVEHFVDDRWRSILAELRKGLAAAAESIDLLAKSQ